MASLGFLIASVGRLTGKQRPPSALDSPIKEEDEGNGRSSTSGRSSSLESLKALEGEMTKRKLIAPGAVRSLPRKHHPATSAYRSACAGCVLHFLDKNVLSLKKSAVIREPRSHDMENLWWLTFGAAVLQVLTN